MSRHTEVKVIKDRYIVQPIPQKGAGDKRPILGRRLIPYLYASIYLVAKKRSGKTTVVRSLLHECAGKETEVIVFCPTIGNDDGWEVIKDELIAKGIKFTKYTDLYDENKVDLLKKWTIDKSNPVDEPVEEPVNTKSNAYLALSEPESKKTPKTKKPKEQAPETIFVFDDFSGSLRNNTIAEFIKVHRHYKTKVIISSQGVKDLKPDALQNIDIWLLFKGHNKDTLEHIYKLATPEVEPEDFIKMYKEATTPTPEDRFPFLYADTRHEVYKHSFNEPFQLSD